MQSGGKSAYSGVLSRAQGCLLGQFIGDSLGSLVEFKGLSEIRRMYPNGVRDMADGGTWNTLAGQPTDDSEMALMLARSLVAQGRFEIEEVIKGYRYWLDSGPFDVGNTIWSGLAGRHSPGSQANGAMMRISPLGIFGVNYTLEEGGRMGEAGRGDNPHSPGLPAGQCPVCDGDHPRRGHGLRRA